MAAHNIEMFKEGNTSSHTETTNSNTPSFTRAIRDVVSFWKLRRIVVAFLLAFWSTFPVEDEFHSDLETDRNRNSQKKLHPCESRCLGLRFSHEVAPVVFTGECIFPKESKLELVDAVTRQQVRHGPLASAQVQIFLLNDDKNWTIEELNGHFMIKKRGEASRHDQNSYLRLEGGVVSVNEIKFKRTPKHMKKLNAVKLGARVVDQPEEIEVREARTGPFTVKDKHLKSKKRYPPLPTDDVWRLEHIYPKGAFHNRLTENGIKTVEDFLIELQNNPRRLRHILDKNMYENYWKKITTHAKTCDLGGRKYMYYHQETEQKISVVFNVAGQVMWLDSGFGLHHFNMLSESQKAYAHKLVETAFANWENVEKYDNEISIMDDLSPSRASPKLGGMSRFHLGNLVTVDECQSLEFQNTSGTTESNRWVDSAECSTSYAFADRQSESDEMCLAITSPGHSGLGSWRYLNSPNDNTSVITDFRDWEECIKFLSSDAIEFEDSPHREPGQAYYAAETSATQFHGSQHGERMDLLQNQFTQFMASENAHTVITDSGDWEEYIKFLSSDAIEFQDSPHGEPGQAYYAAETSATQFHGSQHGERMDLLQNQFTQFMASENAHTVITDSGDWEEYIKFLSSDAIEFQDSPHGEPGQAYYAAETSATQFHGSRHGERMDLLQNQVIQFMVSENAHTVIHEDGTNTNQQRQMNNVLMVPEASTCKGKYKKSWTKISCILKWLLLKKFVELKKVRMTKKRKLISR